MGEPTELRRGMVLEPVMQPGTEHRMCVLLDDVAASPVRLQVVRQDDDGRIELTGREFVVPPAALQMLEPVAGMFLNV